MKNSKTIFLCGLAGIMTCSGSLTAGAERYVDSGKLKSGLLLNELSNYQYNIYDYNTNDDNSVNVLDLCRAKKSVLDSHSVQKQTVELACSRPWITDDRLRITIPVNIKGNVLGVSALSFHADYDKTFFNLENAYSLSGSVFFSREDDRVQFSVSDGRNITDEGDFLYLVFSASSYVPYSTYMFSLSGVEGTICELNGTQRELSAEECHSDTEVLAFTFSSQDRAEITVTTTEAVTTTPETTTTPEITTTEPVTTTPETTTTTPVITTEITAPPPVHGDRMSVSLNDAVISGDGRRLRIPVYIDNNKTGLASLNMTVKYDMNKFSLVGVSQGSYSGYGYVAGNRDNAVFNTNNNQNITDNSGVAAYLEFDVNGGSDSGTYDFGLTNIKAYSSENWNLKEIPKDKFTDKSEVYRFSFAGINAVTTVTTTEITTSPVTTTETTTTTSVTTTETTTPVTTTVTTTTPVTTPPEVQDPSNLEDASEIEIEAMNLILEWRQSLGLSTLRPNNILFKCADIRAAELTELYGSTRPNGEDRMKLLRDMGAPGWFGSSEYYNKGITSASNLVSAFKNMIAKNPGQSVENPSYSNIGVGYNNGYWSIILS